MKFDPLKGIVKVGHTSFQRLSDVLHFSDEKVLRWRVGGKDQNLDELKLDETVAFYVGQIFENDYSGESSYAYDDDFFRGSLQSLAAISQPGDAIIIKDCSAINRIINNEVPGALSASKQRDRIKHYVLRSIAQREDDVYIEDITHEHSALFDALKEYSLDEIAKGEPPQMIPESPTSLDFFEHFAGLIYANEGYRKKVFHCMTKKQQEVIKDDLSQPSEGSIHQRYYYAMVELAIRLYEYLERGVITHGGINLQYKYDGLLQELLKGKLKKQLPVLHEYVQIKCSGEGKIQPFESLRFEKEKFLDNERGEKRKQGVTKFAQVALFGVLGFLGGTARRSNVQKEKTKEQIASILEDELEDKTLTIFKMGGRSDVVHKTSQEKIEHAYRRATRAAEHFRNRYGQGDLSDDELLAEFLELIGEGRLNNVDLNASVEGEIEKIDDLIDEYVMIDKAIRLRQHGVDHLPNKYFRGSEGYKRAIKTIKSQSSRSIDNDLVEKEALGPNAPLYKDPEKFYITHFSGKSYFLKNGREVEVVVEKNTKLLLGRYVDVYEHDDSPYEDEIGQEVAKDLFLRPSNAVLCSRINKMCESIFDGRYAFQKNNVNHIRDELMQEEAFWIEDIVLSDKEIVDFVIERIATNKAYFKANNISMMPYKNLSDSYREGFTNFMTDIELFNDEGRCNANILYNSVRLVSNKPIILPDGKEYYVYYFSVHEKEYGFIADNPEKMYLYTSYNEQSVRLSKQLFKLREKFSKNEQL